MAFNDAPYSFFFNPRKLEPQPYHWAFVHSELLFFLSYIMSSTLPTYGATYEISSNTGAISPTFPTGFSFYLPLVLLYLLHFMIFICPPVSLFASLRFFC